MKHYIKHSPSGDFVSHYDPEEEKVKTGSVRYYKLYRSFSSRYAAEDFMDRHALSPKYYRPVMSADMEKEVDFYNSRRDNCPYQRHY